MPKRRGRGEGSIEELPSGRFRAVLVVRIVGGKRDRLTETFDTRTAAADWLAEKKTAYRYGKLAVCTETLGEYLDAWLKRRAGTVQPKTAAFYTTQVERLKTFPLAALPLRKLTRPVIEADVPTWGKTDQQRKALDVLRIVLNDAVEDGLLPASPARRARKPKAEPRRVAYWTADESRRVLAAAADCYIGPLFQLALDSGMRLGELLGLHWPEVDTAAGTVRVVQALEDDKGKLRLKEPKTAKGRRTIRVGQLTCRDLDAHRESMRARGRDVLTGPVFVGRRDGRLLTHSTFYSRYWLPVVKAAGVPKIRPYDMRHTCATLLLAAGVGVKVISERLGHEDVSMTLRVYAHVLPDAQEAAARSVDVIYAESEGPTVAPRGAWTGVNVDVSEGASTG